MYNVSQWRRRNLRFLRVHRGEFLRGDVPRCVPFPGSPPQDPITETPLPNVIQETEPPSSLPSSPPHLLPSSPLRGPSDLHRPPPSPP
ncbi:vegetative cell wall protein gp1-like [Trematomus bernacchii]|uniref:vegetative cell wall protein gp1-like n=1 Tax=Trematomus bernacchii TaxID=40690 RepID=UPI001469B2C8|nr:vegetative cell wall protein gp1-like [Trematomus bernacchii]